MSAISLKDDPKMISTIKAAIEQQFKKSFGKPFEWKSLIKNSNIRRFAQDNKLILTTHTDLTVLRNYIQDCLKTSDIYTFLSEPLQNQPDKLNYKIKRTNKYEGVHDYKTLVTLIDAHPEGLFVDEDLVNFTYKEAHSDILRAINQKKIKRIFTSLPKDEQHFYVFPRTMEIEYEIRQDMFKHFKYTQYLEMCSHINGMEDDLDSNRADKSRTTKESAADPNYKLPGYLEEKEKWLKRNAKK